jgi:hypothetical protein
MMPLAHQLPKHVPDVRLKCETSIINVLADKLIALLKRRDPLCDNVKLSKAAVATAGVTGILKAWL